MTATVAHFGEENAYAAEAAGRLYPDAELVSCRSFADVMRAVTRGEASCGVLPIENSLAGAIPETYDLLAHAPLAIVDEVVIAVPHCLVGIAGANIDALAQDPLAPGRARPVPPVPLVDPRRAARRRPEHRRRRQAGGRGGRPPPGGDLVAGGRAPAWT